MPSNYSYQDGESTVPFDDRFVSADTFSTGNLRTWGRGEDGQLGNNKTGTFANRYYPYEAYYSQLKWKSGSTYGDINVQSIENTSYWRMSGITADGRLYSWGGPYLLGTGSSSIASVPTRIGFDNNWKQVSCGNRTTAAIKTDGTLWVWGSGSGSGSNNWSQFSSTPITTFAGGNDWKQVSCAYEYTAAIKTDGTLWNWGRNQYGQLGVNDNDSRLTPITTFAGGTNWKQVSVGYHRTTAIKTDGTLWTWGWNSTGNLGTNSNSSNSGSRSTPVTTFAGGNDWKQVSCGLYSTAAIKTDGTLWTWGYNFYGQLGINDTITRSTPVTTFAGGNDWKSVEMLGHSCLAIKTNGSLWVWGQDTWGKLAITNNQNANQLTPTQTDRVANDWKTIFTGYNSRSVGALTFEEDYLSS